MSNWIHFSGRVTNIENHFFHIPYDCIIWERGTNYNVRHFWSSSSFESVESTIKMTWWHYHLHDHCQCHHQYPHPHQGVDPIIYRDPLRSPQFDSTYLNNPSFVGSFEDPHFVYFFFRSSSRWWWWMNYDDAFGQGGWFYFVVMKSKEKNLTSLWSGRELLNIWTAASLSFLG